MSADLVIVNASQVLTFPGPGGAAPRGPEQSDRGRDRRRRGDQGDRVLAVGTSAEISGSPGPALAIDARGGVVMPDH
jgi:hypothetical protein